MRGDSESFRQTGPFRDPSGGPGRNCGDVGDRPSVEGAFRGAYREVDHEENSLEANRCGLVRFVGFLKIGELLNI